MTDSKNSLTNNSTVNNYIFTVPAGVLSLLGFFDTAYLTIIHYKNILPPCSIAHGCEKVLTSRFSTAAGIPIQMLGMVFYTTALVLVILFAQTGRKLFLVLYTLLSFSGLAVSVLLFYLQAFVIGAFCQYCLASELIILLMNIAVILQLLRIKNS